MMNSEDIKYINDISEQFNKNEISSKDAFELIYKQVNIYDYFDLLLDFFEDKDLLDMFRKEYHKEIAVSSLNEYNTANDSDKSMILYMISRKCSFSFNEEYVYKTYKEVFGDIFEKLEEKALENSFLRIYKNINSSDNKEQKITSLKKIYFNTENTYTKKINDFLENFDDITNSQKYGNYLPYL